MSTRISVEYDERMSTWYFSFTRDGRRTQAQIIPF